MSSEETAAGEVVEIELSPRRSDQDSSPRPAPPTAPGTRGRLRIALIAPALAPSVALVVLAGCWQLVALHNHYLLPTLPAIAAQLAGRPGFFARNALVTLQEMAVGLGCSFTIAFLLAVAMVHLRVLERAVMPLAVILNVTPVVSLGPGLVIAFGFGMAPRYLLTGIIVFFPLLVNVLVGLRSVDPGALEVLHTLRASRWEVLWRLRVPSSLPFLFTAARVCVPLSIVGAVVAEFSAAGTARGLGSVIETAAAASDLPAIYAAIAVLGALGVGATLVTVALERRLLAWHPARR